MAIYGTFIFADGPAAGALEKFRSAEEALFKFDLSLDGLPAGKCNFLMHDQDSTMTAPFSTDIEIAG